MKPVVILSTADFDAAIWTNKQHIAVRLAEHCEVFYIESLGLREPNLSLADISRAVRRLLPNKLGQKQLPTPSHSDRLKILSPMVLPWHKYAAVRWMNQLLIAIQVSSRLPKDYDLWSFSPVVYNLNKKASRTIYHSVDLLQGVPGIPRMFYLQSESEILQTASHVVASSSGVQKHLRECGREDVDLWENVADITLFRENRSDDRMRRAIFAGNLTPSKIDFEILQSVVDSGVDLCLAGPVNIDGSGTSTGLEYLLDHPRVSYLGVLNPNELAVELGRSTVGLIPYYLNEYTSGVFPMKVYEYLAAGLSVVSTPLTSLSGKNIPGLTQRSAEHFASEVTNQICQTSLHNESEDDSMGENSWDFRITQMLNLLNPGPS